MKDTTTTIYLVCILVKLSSALLGGSTCYTSNERIRIHHDQGTGKVTTLFGGYDATISQSDPKTPIQVFSNGPLCPYSAQVVTLLNELKLPFEVTKISQPCPDWYLRINPKGSVPALRNPLDGNEIISASKACLNYACDFYERTRASPCPMLPVESETREKIFSLQDTFDRYISRALHSYLLNEDPGQEQYLKQMVDAYLMSLESSIVSSGELFLLGYELTLADLHIFPLLSRIEIALMNRKGYHISKEFPKVGNWLLFMHDRTASVLEIQVSETDIMNNYQEFLEGLHGR